MNPKNSHYQKIKANLRGRLLLNEPLAGHTSYKIGGPADYYFYPADLTDLQTLLAVIQDLEIPRFVIGKGSNLLVSDAGFRGMVIDISTAFNQMVIEDLMISAGAGTLLEDITQMAIQQGLSGMERLSGIPGGIGGAVTLNAGAFDTEIKDILHSITIIDPENGVRILMRNEIEMGYRDTDIAPDAVIIEAKFSMEPGETADLTEIRKEILARRAARQPLLFPSAGSVFKRPPGDYAGRLIEEAGLKGLRIGDAMISEKHANFIINCGAARAEDVCRIIAEVQKTVLKNFNVELKTEIHFLGF